MGLRILLVQKWMFSSSFHCVRCILVTTRIDPLKPTLEELSDTVVEADFFPRRYAAI